MSIIDLRYNGGGHLDTMTFVPSYLLDGAAVHLIDFIVLNNDWSRASGNCCHFGVETVVDRLFAAETVTSLGVARQVGTDGLMISLPNSRSC